MIINGGDLSFSQVNDPIKTEQIIFDQLKDMELNLPYVGVPLAYRINTRGIPDTQSLIKKINGDYPQKKFFVCQHILVNHLDFGDNLVFTPHTTKSDQYFFVPHYNPIYDSPPERIPINNRKWKASFIGDYNTNPLRTEIGKIFSENILCHPTGKWFFAYDPSTKESLKARYQEVLENTKFPLCPPGTGPSTLRFFETLSTGGIPVIFNDLKIPPSLEKLIIKSTLEELKIGNFFKDTDQDFWEERSKEIYNLYWSEYSNHNLKNSILQVIGEKI